MNKTAEILFELFRLLFDESSRTFRNIPQFGRLSAWQKRGLMTIYVILSVHFASIILRILSLLFIMNSIPAMEALHDIQPIIYFFEKYFIKGDAYVLAAFVLLLLPWARLSYYVTFRMGDYFRELLADVESMLDCAIDWKTLIQLVVSDGESFSIRKKVSKTISLLEQTCQGLHFRYNPYASRREKAAATFLFKYSMFWFDFAYLLLKIETVLVSLLLVINLPEPLTPHLSLLNILDFGLLMAQVYLYIHCTLLTIIIGFLDGMLPGISLPASYRRFRQLLTSGSHASMLYPAMFHHQRLFVSAAHRFILNNRKLIPYSLMVQFFSTVTAITALLASMIMTEQTGSAGEFLLRWPLIGMIIGMLALSLVYQIGYSKILYYHTPLVISSNVRMAMVPGMLARKVKGNTFVETLNIRKKIAISLPFIGRITSKSVGACMVIFSSLFLSCVENYY